MRFHSNPSLDPAPAESGELKASWWSRLQALLHHDRAINLVVVAAVIVGFFHGWLKLKIRHPATTFFFDVLLYGALGLMVLRLRRGESLFPKCAMTRAILMFYGVVIAYALIPSDLPALARLAGIRAWCFPSLVFFLGYHLTRTNRQSAGYFTVIILLGVVTALYGVFQDPAEIRQRSLEDEYFAKRFVGTYHLSSTGEIGVRVFSTFVSAGAFGGVMSFCIGLAACLAIDSKGWNRVALLAAMCLMAYGILLSGSRTALIMAATSLAVVMIWMRRFSIPLVAGVVIFCGFNLLTKEKDPVIGERFAALLEKGTLWKRYAGPLEATYKKFKEAPLGTGTSSSSLGVPFFMMERIESPKTVFRFAEGDIECITTDMGIVGLGFFVFMVGNAIHLSMTSIPKLRNTDGLPIALGCAVSLIPAILSSPVGSPFLGIPAGQMLWFFLGSLQKIVLITKEGGGEGHTTSRPAQFPRKKLFYYRG